MDTSVPYRLTKKSLYEVLKQKSRAYEVDVIPVCTDGWTVQIRDCIPAHKALRNACEASGISETDYWSNYALSGFLIQISRAGMDPEVQELFDSAARGEWK